MPVGAAVGQPPETRIGEHLSVLDVVHPGDAIERGQQDALTQRAEREAQLQLVDRQEAPRCDHGARRKRVPQR